MRGRSLPRARKRANTSITINDFSPTILFIAFFQILIYLWAYIGFMSRFACSSTPGRCTRCAECCRFEAPRSLTKEEEETVLIAIFQKTGFIYPYGLSTAGLDIQSYEYSKLQNLATEKGINLELRPKKVLYDTKRQLTIVFDWLLPCAECPFLDARNVCLIYPDRPDLCRLFPDTSGKIAEVEKRHSIVPELIKQEVIAMPQANSYPELTLLAKSSELINFDDFVEIKDFED
jgi:Fe-S-cluster containining protein